MDNKAWAKRLMVHYFSMIAEAAGINWDSDNTAEIEMIVDAIIDAAVLEHEDKLEMLDADRCSTGQIKE